MESSAIFHRSLETTYPDAVSSHGVFIVTSSGQEVLDGSSGAAVSSLGHNNPEIIDAVVKQAQQLCFAHTSFFTSDPAEELAQLLLDKSDGAFSKVCFLCSGSEAVESALKIARQHHVYNGELERVNFIGRMHSYHGNTLGALAAGNNPSRREIFGPILSPAFHHVGRCFYDADGASLSEQEYEDSLIAEFAAKIAELGVKTVAALIIEPVVGATLGAVGPTKAYLPRLRQLCDDHGILLIFDEVMCGMGRVGSYHAWQRFGGVAPDLQTIGKGLGGGYLPLSAVLLGPKVFDMFNEHSRGSNKFTSGHTFQGHPVACASALAVQNILQRDNLLTNVNKMGELLAGMLNHGLPPQLVKCGAKVRGLGLFRAVDFGTAGQEFGGPLASDVRDEAFRTGAAVYPCSSVVDAVLFAPPFIINAEEVAQLTSIFLTAVQTVLSRRRAAVNGVNGVNGARKVNGVNGVNGTNGTHH